MRLKALATLIGLGLIAGCSADLPHEAPFDPDSPLSKQAHAALGGSVVLEGENDAGGVAVSLTNSERAYNFTTANDGLVFIPGIVPGRYTLKLSSRFFKPVEREIELALGEKKVIEKVTLELGSAAVSGKALALSIKDQTEFISGGVKVELVKTGSIRAAMSAPAFRAAADTTDTVTYTAVSAPDGTYSIDAVDAGEYQVIASNAEVPAQDFGTVTVTGDGAVTAEDVLLSPLTGFFLIQGMAADGPSALYTGTSTVELQLSGFNATQVKIGRSADGTSAGCTFPSAPITYDSIASYVIATPGLETVCVRYLDVAGLETESILGKIIFDNAPPKLASLTINDGATATGSLTAGVRFSAVDTETTLHAYQLTNSLPANWDAVPKYAFQPIVLHTLGGQGLQTVFARFQDAAGNWAGPVSASIEVSTVPPTGVARLTDDQGATIGVGETTRSNRIYVMSSVTSQTTLQMQVATNGSYTGVAWESYSAAKPVDLSPQSSHLAEGRQIWARVRDGVGRVLDLISGQLIQLDSRGPSGTVAAPSLVNTLSVPLTFTVNDPGAYVEIAENPAFLPAISFAFQPATSYTLVSATEGQRTLYVRFIDAAGNASSLLAAVVQVDISPPQLAALSIRQGALTNSRTIDLDLTALDATEMSVAEDTACSNAWVPFTTWQGLTFAADIDGLKAVAVKFRDAAGNETPCITQEITYDHTDPVPGAFLINSGDEYARERAVTLTIAVTGATDMQVAETPVFSGAWQPVTTTANYTLSAGDGTKTLYLKFRDAAGNEAQATPAVIRLDTVAPEQPLATVNDGSGYARQVTATLTLSATGSPSHHRWTADGIIDNKPWLPFTTATSVSLGEGSDGARTVVVQYKDLADNLSLAIQANVYLDRQSPSAPTLRIDDGAATSSDTAGLVTLTLNAADTGSGLEKVRLAATESALATAAALSFEPTKIYTLDNYTADGIKQVWASFYDKAGNYSTPVSAVIKLDRTPPSALLSFPMGTLSSTGIVTVGVNADSDTVSMLVSNQPGFPGAAWQPFESSFTYAFPAVEGAATLYARFRDDAGNDSGTFSLGLTIDTSPPVLESVEAAVVSDTIIWDDLNPDAVSYTVYLYDQGVAKTATTTTEKRLYVGRMNPGFTVVANYADGTTSAFSQAPGYSVPPTFPAFLGLRAGAANNALLTRLAQQYGLGTTTTGCAQVVFTNSYDDGYYAPNGTTGGGSGGTCPGTNPIRISSDTWAQSPPAFTAAVAATPNNPFAGHPPLRISGGGRSYYYSSSENPHTPLLTVPGFLKWQGSPYQLAVTGDVVASLGAYNPAAGTGANELRLYFPLAAFAVTDDVSVYFTPSTMPPVSFGFLENGGLAFPTSGRFAGLDVTSVDFRNRYYEGFAALNGLWDFSQNNYSSFQRPGTIQLPFYASDGTYDTQSLSVSSVWSYCSYYWDPVYGWLYDCEDTGQSAVLDLAASTLTLSDLNPYWDDWYREYSVMNQDGSRGYRLPFPTDGITSFHWANEYPQDAFEPYLRSMIRRMAAPVRVRGTGIPLLTNHVTGVSEMLVGLDAQFTDANWQTYADEVTLPEGTTTVWVRYRDEAGNTTAAQEITIAAPEEAPRLEYAVILGSNGGPGYTTGPDVTAYILGLFPSKVMVRMSTSPAFQDDGWMSVEDPQTGFEWSDPLTGEKELVDLEGMKVVRVPITIPDVLGTYAYYFWVKDASRNFSRGVPGVVIYDTTQPEAEFSLKPGEGGDVQFQARWTVTKTPVVPSLAALTPTPVTTFALPFSVPFLNTSASTLWIDDAKACLQVGYLNACPLTKLTTIDDHSVTISAQQAVVIWRGRGPYGTPVTTAATIFPDGGVRLSYWNTGARVSMYGEVDLVETPYADFNYAAVLGSIEYRPNQLPLQFLLRSHTGNLKKISARESTVWENGDGTWSVESPWRSYTVADRGVVRYTGTAYSLAGAAGRVTTRDVYVSSGTYNDKNLANIEATPLTDTRWWVTWDMGADNFTTAFRVNGESTAFGALVGGIPEETGTIAEAHQRMPMQYERGNTYPYFSQGRSVSYQYGESLVMVDDGRLETSGVPVTPDFEARLLYGTDGSLWDLSDPRRPTPIRAFSGTYPSQPGNAVRVGSYLWSQGGVWDISSPEAPIRLQLARSPSGTFATYQGRVYEFDNWQYWIYDAAAPASAPTTGWYSTYGAGDYVFRTGSKLFAPVYDLVAIDLTNPLAPDTIVAGYINDYYPYFDADDRGSHYQFVAASGFARYYADNGVVLPGFGNFAAPKGAPLLWNVRGLTAEGPWLYGIESDGLRIAHIGRALPDDSRRLYTSTSGYGNPIVAADTHFVYVCDGTVLRLYDQAGNLAVSGTVKGCNNIKPMYPYVLVGNERYRIEGSTLVDESLTFCDPFSTYSWCPGGRSIGTAFADQIRKVWVGADNLVPLSDTNCEPVAATDSLIFCVDYSNGDIKVAPFSALGYRGAITGPNTLPVTKLINDGGNFTDAGSEYFSTDIGTYYVKGLQSALLVGPPSLRFIAPGLATNYDGRLFELDRETVRPVGAADTGSPLYLGAGGSLVQQYTNEVWTTQWGPGLPEFRLGITEAAQSRDIAQSAGYVYTATPSGIARTDGLMQVALGVQRADLTVHHSGAGWELRGTDQRPITTVVEAPPGDMQTLCESTLVRSYKDPQQPWNPPVVSICNWTENVSTARVFEGDLGNQWLGLRGVSLDAIGNVSSLAVDPAGRIYAGVQTGTTGVYMYDPADASLVAADFLATGPVLDVAVTSGMLYVVLEGGDLQAYDMNAGYSLVWTNVSGYFTRVRATEGWVAGGADGWNTQLLDPVSGNTNMWCWSFSGAFEFAARRWGGSLHTVLMGFSGTTLYVVDAATCNMVEQLNVPSTSDIRGLRRESGFLIAGNTAGEIYITQDGAYAHHHMFTILKGSAPSYDGVLAGPFVYTIGSEQAQIFQLH